MWLRWVVKRKLTVVCDELLGALTDLYRLALTRFVKALLKELALPKHVPSNEFRSVQFSSVPWPTGSSEGYEERFSIDLLPVFSRGGQCEQFWHRQACALFDVVHPAFPLPTTASPTLQGALKDGFGEAAVACDIPKPCKLPSLDSCQKKFLWTYREADLALQPIVGLVLRVGDAENRRIVF